MLWCEVTFCKMADRQLEEYDDVVISGVGGFFPKCSNMEEFKHRLLNNEEMLGSRWKAGKNYFLIYSENI